MPLGLHSDAHGPIAAVLLFVSVIQLCDGAAVAAELPLAAVPVEGPASAPEQEGGAPSPRATPAMPSSAATPTFLSLPSWPGQTSGPTLRIGAYAGQISNGSLLSTLFEPWTIRLHDSYLVDVHAIYTAYRFQTLPLAFEIEGGLAHRFGRDHQAEVDLIPMARWTWLPWNDLLYTNIRLGLLGASYVDGISPTELHRSGTDHGSRYLNFLVPEVTFAPGPQSTWEVFVRVHHRSGIYGLIDGVGAGSNYVSVGARFGVF